MWSNWFPKDQSGLGVHYFRVSYNKGLISPTNIRLQQEPYNCLTGVLRKYQASDVFYPPRILDIKELRIGGGIVKERCLGAMRAKNDEKPVIYYSTLKY